MVLYLSLPSLLLNFSSFYIFWKAWSCVFSFHPVLLGFFRSFFNTWFSIFLYLNFFYIFLFSIFSSTRGFLLFSALMLLPRAFLFLLSCCCFMILLFFYYYYHFVILVYLFWHCYPSLLSAFVSTPNPRVVYIIFLSRTTVYKFPIFFLWSHISPFFSLVFFSSFCTFFLSFFLFFLTSFFSWVFLSISFSSILLLCHPFFCFSLFCHCSSVYFVYFLCFPSVSF